METTSDPTGRRWWRALLALVVAIAVVGSACSSDAVDDPSARVTAPPEVPGEGARTDAPGPGSPTLPRAVGADEQQAAPPTGPGEGTQGSTAPADTSAARDAGDLGPTTAPPRASTVPAPAPASVARIVSLSATHTETLFALGVGDRVVAVDAESDHPAAALAVRDDSLLAARADVDTLVALNPDLVIVGEDLTGIVARLDAAGLASWHGPRPGDFAGVLDQIRDLGGVVGAAAEAEALVADMAARLTAAQRRVAGEGEGLTYFHEIDPSYFTVVRGSFLDVLYGELGLIGIIDPGVEGIDGVVQVTPETVIAAAPDLIVLADGRCCAVDASTVAARPGWGDLPAVAAGAIVVIDDRLLARWGPRTVEVLEAIAAAF